MFDFNKDGIFNNPVTVPLSGEGSVTPDGQFTVTVDTRIFGGTQATITATITGQLSGN